MGGSERTTDRVERFSVGDRRKAGGDVLSGPYRASFQLLERVSECNVNRLARGSSGCGHTATWSALARRLMSRSIAAKAFGDRDIDFRTLLAVARWGYVAPHKGVTSFAPGCGEGYGREPT